MAQFNPFEIGARIRQARDEAGLTQEQLAGMGTFTSRSLQSWEAGVRVPFKHLNELANLLGKGSSEWFLYGGETPDEATERYDCVLRRLSEVEAQTQKTFELVRDLHKRLQQPPGSPPDAER